MNNDQRQAIKDKLHSQGKDNSEIRSFIEELENLLVISEHNQPLNVSRNVPLDSDDKNRLINISKSAAKMRKDMQPAHNSPELRSRLQFTGDKLSEIDNLLAQLEACANVALHKQSACTKADYVPPHLREEYRGKNTTSHSDVETLVLLQSTLNKHFPEIKATKGQTVTDTFSNLAGILLNKKDPRRNIDKFLEIVTRKY